MQTSQNRIQNIYYTWPTLHFILQAAHYTLSKAYNTIYAAHPRVHITYRSHFPIYIAPCRLLPSAPPSPCPDFRTPPLPTIIPGNLPLSAACRVVPSSALHLDPPYPGYLSWPPVALVAPGVTCFPQPLLASSAVPSVPEFVNIYLPFGGGSSPHFLLQLLPCSRRALLPLRRPTAGRCTLDVVGFLYQSLSPPF